MSDEDDPTLTGADVFGEPVEGEAVQTTAYPTKPPVKTAPRFRYRRDGRAFPIDEPRELVETELPLDQCSRGESFRRRRD